MALDAAISELANMLWFSSFVVNPRKADVLVSNKTTIDQLPLLEKFLAKTGYTSSGWKVAREGTVLRVYRP